MAEEDEMEDEDSELFPGEYSEDETQADAGAPKGKKKRFGKIRNGSGFHTHSTYSSL